MISDIKIKVIQWCVLFTCKCCNGASNSYNFLGLIQICHLIYLIETKGIH